MDIVTSIFITLFGLLLVINHSKIGAVALRSWYQVHPHKKLLWDKIYKFSALIVGIFFYNRWFI